MLFAILGDDRTEGLALRLETRPAHLEYLKGLGSRLRFAGPFLGPDEKPTGSLVVVEAESIEAARALADADPYAKAGLFRHVDVRRWNWAINNPDAA